MWSEFISFRNAIADDQQMVTIESFVKLAHTLERELASAREQRDTLAGALERVCRHGPIMGSTGDYRQGQLDVLESVARILNEALAAAKESSDS